MLGPAAADFAAKLDQTALYIHCGHGYKYTQILFSLPLPLPLAPDLLLFALFMTLN